MADKQLIDKFFSDLSSGTTWNVGVSIARKNALPLDNTSVFKSLAELTTYTQNGMAYMGQPVAVIAEDGSVDFYVLDADKNPQEVGKATTGDDKSIILSDGVLELYGFKAADVGAYLTKGSDGKIAWVVPSNETVDGLSKNVDSLLETVNGITADPDNNIEGKPGLVQKVADNAAAIKANTDAIAILNGDGDIEGSVAYKIAQILNAETDNDSIDTLKEIAAWINEHPEDVAAMNESITANANAITALQGLVGSENVATKILTEINNALKVDGIDKYALAADLTALAGRVSTAEGKITTIENLIKADPLHTHANKTELDKIADGDVAKWNENLTAVDAIETELAKGEVHKHTNKDVLNAITATDVNNWNAAEENAKTYVQGYAATKAQGELAASALQNVTILGKSLSKSGEVSLTVDEAKTALGLKSAAYSEASAFDAAGSAAAVQGDTTHTVKDAYELANGKATAADIEAALKVNGVDKYALATNLTTHTENGEIHVTADQKTKWNTAADLVDTLTGGQAGGITNTINDAISAHKTESEARYDAKYETITNVDAVRTRVTSVETLSSKNEGAISTINQTIATHGSDLETAKSDITQLKTDSALHAIKSEVETALAGKADKEAYDNTVETVAALKQTVDNFFNDNAALDDTVDTLKEIAEYIKNDESGASDMAAQIGALETTVGKAAEGENPATGLVKKTADNTAAINSEVSRATTAEGALSTRIKKLEDNEAGYATTGQVSAAQTAAETTAKSYTDTTVKALADGAVTTNTGNIATNTADITTLKTTKANIADVYSKEEVYTKTEVDNAIANAEITWGNF